MSEPKISVVIPVYNSADFFARTLECVLRQTSPAHEIVVINDGSTDNTQELLDRYKGRIVTKTIKNSGCAAARNEGVRIATGDVIAFLDGDDLWFRKKLKVVMKYLKRYPDIDFFCSNYLVYSEYHGRIVRHYENLANADDFNFDEPLRRLPFKLLLESNFVGTPSTVVVRKRFFEKTGGFDPSCKIVEDLDYFFRAAARSNFVLIHDVLLYKHNHAENMSHNKIKLYEGHKRVFNRCITGEREFISNRHLKRDVDLGLANINYILGRLYFETGQRKHAYKLFWEAFKAAIYPSNFFQFIWETSKKTARVLTGNAISKKNLKRALHSAH